MQTFWRTVDKFSQPPSSQPAPGIRSSGLVQKNPAQEAEGMLLLSILSKQIGSMSIYFEYFLFRTNRSKGVKATQVGLNLKSLLSGLEHFPWKIPCISSLILVFSHLFHCTESQTIVQSPY